MSTDPNGERPGGWPRLLREHWPYWVVPLALSLALLLALLLLPATDVAPPFKY